MLPNTVTVAGLQIHGPHMPSCTWVNAIDGRVWCRKVFADGSITEMETSHFLVNAGYSILYVGVNFKNETAIVSRAGVGVESLIWLSWLQDWERGPHHMEFISFIAEQLANGEQIPVTGGTFDLGDLIILAIEDENEHYDELITALSSMHRHYPLNDDGVAFASGDLARIVNRLAYEWAERHAEDVAAAMKADADEDRAAKQLDAATDALRGFHARSVA